MEMWNSLKITNPLTEITSHSEKKMKIEKKIAEKKKSTQNLCTSHFHMYKTNWMERVSYFAQFVILICHVKMCTVLLRICNALRHSISMHFASIISGWITRLFLLIPFLLVFLCVAAAAFVAICSSLSHMLLAMVSMFAKTNPPYRYQHFMLQHFRFHFGCVPFIRQ